MRRKASAKREMPKYIDYINHFWGAKLARDDLGAREIAAYMRLLHVANRQGWPEVFEASTAQICIAVGCHRTEFSRARERLTDAGLLEIVAAGNRHKSPRYRLKMCLSCVGGVSLDVLRGVSPSKTERKTEREGGQAGSTLSNFDEVVSIVEAEFPNRADVRKLAERMRAYGGPITADRLKHWVEDERKPVHKPSVPEAEPENWRDIVPGDLGKRSWEYVAKQYPEEAANARAMAAEKEASNA